MSWALEDQDDLVVQCRCGKACILPPRVGRPPARYECETCASYRKDLRRVRDKIRADDKSARNAFDRFKAENIERMQRTEMNHVIQRLSHDRNFFLAVRDAVQNKKVPLHIMRAFSEFMTYHLEKP